MNGIVNITDTLTIPDNNLIILIPVLNEILNNDTNISNMQSNISDLQAYNMTNDSLQSNQLINTSDIETINSASDAYLTH
jgi:hypothetical protein